MLKISDNVKVEREEGKEIVRISDNLKEEITLNLDGKSDIKIIIGKDSEVKVVGVSKFDKELEIDVGENSKLNWLELNSNGNKSKINTKLSKGSESKILSVVFGTDSEEFEIDNKVVHAGSNSKSDMVVRAVMNDKSKIFQTGLVKVEKDCKDCEGYQKSDIVLLSADAYAEAVPNLEIENNDVSCSHGATISQIDEDKLFYLQSRGLSLGKAKKTIIEGFFEPVFREFGEDLRNEVLEKIGNGN